MENILEVNNLNKTFNKKDKAVHAIENVSFTVKRGSVVGLLGHNGAGKTTTIKCILGLMKPTSGEIKVDGLDMKKNLRKSLRKVGAVLEGNRNIYWNLTPLENLIFFANLVGIPKKVAKEKGLELLRRFQLESKIQTKVADLSRGMQQKVAICAALIREPDLLLLDEPTLGLDVETTLHMKDLLLQLAKEENRAIVITSHQLDLIEDICESVIIMQNGKIISEEEVSKLLHLFSTRSYQFITEQPISPDTMMHIKNRFADAKIETNDIMTKLDVTFVHGKELYQLMDILKKENNMLHSVEHLTPDLEQVFMKLLQGVSS
ncbi:ABC transporter ATP-binding protein [Bacillus sp. FSL K6-3431]|uniref:ABC transporter ATP-binding protein n=1 Tax=Bacillus sp. FSL K6-3431 TaxID=2921500 RepID=UPI0030F53B44